MSENNNLKSGFRNSLDDDLSAKTTKENPWENDFANRKEFARKLSTIIENIGAKAPAVILLDGEWGTGKTYFLKSFRFELEERGHKAIYFDAFAEDFSSDPLLAICGQLRTELKTDKSMPEEWKNTLKDMMSVAMSKKMLWNTINAIGILTGKEKLTKLLTDTINTIDINIFDQYIESRNKLEKLKKEILNIVEKNKTQEGSERKPLVFIIDELDRCRPTFALELLERVKHLFRVPGIIFILGANQKSLMNSVTSEYGNQDHEYLQKFFDLEVTLPDAPPSELIKRYVDGLNYKVLMDDFGGGKYKNIADTVITNRLYYRLMDIMGVPFRQAQRSVQLLLLSLLVSENSHKTEWWYKIATVACLTLLKVNQPNLYKGIAHKGITCEEVIEKMAPVFEKSSYPDADRVKDCQVFFNRSIYFLAEGEEKRKIEESKFPASKYINEESWRVIQKHLLDRSEVVAMLENLDCKKTNPAY